MESDHANRNQGGPATTTRLDATGDREVVFCHICDNEWYRDCGGLTCPRCQGDAVEIISPENDPRPAPQPQQDDLRDLRGHHPWNHGAAFDSDDPPEDDIADYVHDESPNHNNEDAHREFPFHPFVPGFAAGPTGRSGPEILYGQSEPTTTTNGGWTSRTFRSTNGNGATTTFTFSSGNFPAGPDGQQHPGFPFSADMNNVLTSLFGTMAGGDAFPPLPGQQSRNIPGMPPGLANIFASMLNPANAVAGDAVYSQEALDRIISNLMEQHGTSSNAPGPAPASDIANLRKKQVDTEMLGVEGKAECSVCMDDVAKGDEVVVLPCSHWFHEQCATLWLSEHNTCPICRKSISSGNGSSTTNASGSTNATSDRSNPEFEIGSTSSSPPGSSQQDSAQHANRDTSHERQLLNQQQRLNRIRESAGVTVQESAPSDTSDMPGGTGRRSSSHNITSGGMRFWLRRRATGDRDAE